MNYWLLKSEPDSFSIDALARSPKQTVAWDGVRNYQARNMLRDAMKKGDRAFFYHSSCAVPGIVGIVRVTREGYPDPSAFDPRHHYYDGESDPVEPRWFVVDVKLERRLEHVITLEALRKHAKQQLREFVLLRRGNRLSVMPVTHDEWQFILMLE